MFQHIEREKLSVQSEFEKFRSMDSSLINAVLADIGDPTHPFNSFDIGNKAAFDEKDYRDKILWFHSNYYKANFVRD